MLNVSSLSSPILTCKQLHRGERLLQRKNEGRLPEQSYQSRESVFESMQRPCYRASENRAINQQSPCTYLLQSYLQERASFKLNHRDSSSVVMSRDREDLGLSLIGYDRASVAEWRAEIVRQRTLDDSHYLWQRYVHKTRSEVVIFEPLPQHSPWNPIMELSVLACFSQHLKANHRDILSLATAIFESCFCRQPSLYLLLLVKAQLHC